jgi:hypothetical protein
MITGIAQIVTRYIALPLTAWIFLAKLPKNVSTR